VDNFLNDGVKQRRNYHNDDRILFVQRSDLTITSATCVWSFGLELPFPPSGNVQTRHTRGGGHYINPKILAYRALVGRLLSSQGYGQGGSHKPLGGPLSVSVVAAPDSRRAMDADNRLKCLMDALVHGGLLEDDSNRVVRRLSWEWCDPEQGGKVFVALEGLA
jgi:crossover junction endodeoxyribonuclease RusA